MLEVRSLISSKYPAFIKALPNPLPQKIAAVREERQAAIFYESEI
jgi:hypothetical protein